MITKTFLEIKYINKPKGLDLKRHVIWNETLTFKNLFRLILKTSETLFVLYSYKGGLGIQFLIIQQSENEDIEEKIKPLPYSVVSPTHGLINLENEDIEEKML